MAITIQVHFKWCVNADYHYLPYRYALSGVLMHYRYLGYTRRNVCAWNIVKQVFAFFPWCCYLIMSFLFSLILKSRSCKELSSLTRSKAEFSLHKLLLCRGKYLVKRLRIEVCCIPTGEVMLVMLCWNEFLITLFDYHGRDGHSTEPCSCHAPSAPTHPALSHFQSPEH